MKQDRQKPKRTFRSLPNYKAMHAQTAKDKGKYEEFMAATTLTRAKRILWGR